MHHAEVIVLRGDNYRLKGKGGEVLLKRARDVSSLQPALRVQVSTAFTRAVMSELGFQRRAAAGLLMRFGRQLAVPAHFPQTKP